MSKGQVDLVIPGLFQLPLGELDADFLRGQLPALNSILRFGRPVSNTRLELDSILASCLGLGQSREIPFASAFVEEKNAEQGGYVLCRPVHLKPDMRNAFALPLEEDDDIQHDIERLINDLSKLFKVDCDISDLGNGLWLMRLKQCQPPQHYPHYLSVIGRKVDQYIEQSRNVLPWYQLMNEMQMFLHSHTINQQRLLDGKLSINSLWCWGAGEYLPPKSSYASWYCDDVLLKRYADGAGIDNQPISTLAATTVSDDILVVELGVLTALKSSSDSDLQALLTSIEKSVFLPLLSKVMMGQQNLWLRTGHDVDLSMGRLSMLKRWRKAASLVDWLA